MALQKYTQRITDNNSETGDFSMWIDAAAVGLDIDALRDTTMALSIGTLGNVTLTDTTTHSVGSDAASSDKAAQRENKYVCFYSDDVLGHKYSSSIPSCDLGEQVNEAVDLTAGNGLAFKSAFEAVVKSRDDNAVTLNKVIFRTSRN